MSDKPSSGSVAPVYGPLLTGSARALSWGREVTRAVTREVTVDATTASRRALSSALPSTPVPISDASDGLEGPEFWDAGA